MDAINAFIVRRQSTHERSLSNAMRKAVAISLEATRQPHQRMQQGVMRASWDHNHTHIATTTIAARASIAATGAQRTQTVTFCWLAQESRVVCLMQWQWWQLSSPSARPTWTAQAPQQWRSQQRQAQQQEESPQARGQGLQAPMPTGWPCQSLVRRMLH